MIHQNTQEDYTIHIGHDSELQCTWRASRRAAGSVKAPILKCMSVCVCSAVRSAHMVPFQRGQRAFQYYSMGLRGSRGFSFNRGKIEILTDFSKVEVTLRF